MIFRRENMSRITIKQKESIGRKAAAAAKEEFIRHCRVKNLKGGIITYCEENLGALPDIRRVQEQPCGIQPQSLEARIAVGVLSKEQRKAAAFAGIILPRRVCRKCYCKSVRMIYTVTVCMPSGRRS